MSAAAGVRWAQGVRGLIAIALLEIAVACAAVYPRVDTPIRPAPEGKELVPAPPPEILAIGFTHVEIPRRTRDGRSWDELGGGAPDPFGKVMFGSKELFRTETQADTFAPTWPLTPVRNYSVPIGEVMRIEIWNDNAINNQPICIRIIDDVRAETAESGELSLECEGGGRIELQVRPARPKFGLGFTYELRADGSAITNVLEKSPAERAGLQARDEIVEVMGKPVKGMSADALRSTINANSRHGLVLKLRQPGSIIREVKLQEGPIYSLLLE